MHPSTEEALMEIGHSVKINGINKKIEGCYLLGWIEILGRLSESEVLLLLLEV